MSEYNIKQITELSLAFDYDQKECHGKHTEEFLYAVQHFKDIKSGKTVSLKPDYGKLSLTDRMMCALKAQHILTVDDICRCSADELLRLRSVGPIAVKNLEAELKKFGRELRKDD